VPGKRSFAAGRAFYTSRESLRCGDTALHDVEELEDLAGEIGVELDEDNLEEAREDINQYIASREEQAEMDLEEERLNRGYRESKNEEAQIAAVFGQLGEEGRGELTKARWRAVMLGSPCQAPKVWPPMRRAIGQVRDAFSSSGRTASPLETRSRSSQLMRRCPA